MRKFLTPREHGAYAQLAFPLLSGLILGSPTVPAFGFGLAAVSLFLAYEPLVVLFGVRGVRILREESSVARRQLAVLVTIALVLGAGALIGSADKTRLLAVIPAGFCALLVPLVPTRRVKTLAGETAVAAALASMHLPVASAGGAHGSRLWGPPAVWFAGFFVATLTVHAIKARQKQREGWIGTAAVLSSIIGVMAAAALVIAVPSLRILGFALALPVLAVFAVNAARVSARALKRVGWTLVAADTATLLLLTLL